MFSSWTATPAAVASLLSYEVERPAAQDTDERVSNYREHTTAARKSLRLPFTYSVKDEKPSSMATLLLFWPFPGWRRVIRCGSSPRRTAFR